MNKINHLPLNLHNLIMVSAFQKFSLFLFFALILIPFISLNGQKVNQVEIKNAEVLEARTVNGKSLKILKNNVILFHDGATMYCDSAYLDQLTNTLIAFNHVKILQGDSFTINSDNLNYDGNKKFAILKGNVTLLDGSTTLTTDAIYYDKAQKMAYYTTPGKVSSGDNVLTSQKGYYFQSSKDIFFKKEVVIVSKENRILSDTMKYNTISKISYFYGPTHIYTDKDTIYAENGFFDSKKSVAIFGKNAWLKSDKKKLKGDTLEYYSKLKIGIAKSNVNLEDTVEKLSILGDYAKYFELTKKTILKGRVLVSKQMDKDTMHITADSMISKYDSSGKFRIIIGNRNVKILSKQFQGNCDSLYYGSTDSVIRMFKNPVYWFGTYQGTADVIFVYTEKNKIQKTEMLKNAFLVSPEAGGKYSQVKGKNMYGSFKNNKLKKMLVKGNAESLYFLKDDGNKYIGANKIKSAEIKMEMDSGGISKITFTKEPEGRIIPIDKLSEEDSRLSGLKPRFNEKPISLAQMREEKTPLKPQNEIQRQPSIKKKKEKKSIKSLKLNQ